MLRPSKLSFSPTSRLKKKCMGGLTKARTGHFFIYCEPSVSNRLENNTTAYEIWTRRGQIHERHHERTELHKALRIMKQVWQKHASGDEMTLSLSSRLYFFRKGRAREKGKIWGDGSRHACLRYTNIFLRVALRFRSICLLSSP